MGRTKNVFDLNGVLMGFVVGLASGIFLAYKLAQRVRQERMPPMRERSRKPISNVDLLDESGQSIFLENKGVKK